MHEVAVDLRVCRPSELVVRELEKDAALEARHTAIAAAGAEVDHFMRRTLA